MVVLSVEPVDSEISTVQLKQTPQFKFTTSCEGMDCFINAALDFENPQTIGLYVGILLVVFLAVYRRGQTLLERMHWLSKKICSLNLWQKKSRIFQMS